MTEKAGTANKSRILFLLQYLQTKFKYHVDGKPRFVYSWRLEPTDKLPAGKKPCLSLRELEKQIGYDLDSQLDPAGKNMTVGELVARYVSTKTGVRSTTKQGYNFVQKLLEQTEFSGRKISDIRTSDAKIYLIKLQESGRRYSTVKTVRGVHRSKNVVGISVFYYSANCPSEGRGK